MIHYYNGKKYISTDELARKFTAAYGIKVTPYNINVLCHHYKVLHTTYRGINFFSSEGVTNMRERKPNFMEVLNNIVKYNNAYGPKKVEAPSFLPKIKSWDDIKVGDNMPEADMEKVSQMMIDKYQTEGRVIKINESQFKRLFENSEEEGFVKDRASGQYMFKPNDENQRNADTRIFNQDKSFRVNVMLLPKSGVKCYNLYELKNLNVSKILKHRQDKEGNKVDWYSNRDNYTNTIGYFLKRSAFYIKHLIGDSNVDIFTCPQSSSPFNKQMLNVIMKYFPQSQGIQLKPDMLVKNVRGIYVNTDYAKQLGMTDEEIHNLMNKVAKWHSDEDLRDLRKNIISLKQEIANIVATRKRGRPSREFIDKQRQLDIWNNQASELRKGKRGRDSTLNKDGSVKSWQIKSLDDKDRKAIEGLFDLNPKYNGIQQRLSGKTVVVFDDNISSGATLDDFCLKLKQLGVANVIAFTLGTISPTIYKMGDRIARNI